MNRKKIILIFLLFPFILFITACSSNNIKLNFSYCIRYDNHINYGISTNLPDNTIICYQIHNKDYTFFKEGTFSVKNGRYKGKILNVPDDALEMWIAFQTLLPPPLNQPDEIIDKYEIDGEKIQGREIDNKYPWHGYKTKAGTLTRIEAIYIIPHK